MSHQRGQESPMDFQYENGTGPMDGRSPFAQIGINNAHRSQLVNNDKKRMCETGNGKRRVAHKSCETSG